MTLHAIHIAGADAPITVSEDYDKTKEDDVMTEKVTWAEARDSEAAKTGTRSPVALFQARELVPPEEGWGSPDDTRDVRRGAGIRGATVAEDHVWCWDDGEPLTADEAINAGLAGETWRTERAFLNTSDAWIYGDRHGHDYPDGWRVYSVPAEGDLEELLAEGASWKVSSRNPSR